MSTQWLFVKEKLRSFVVENFLFGQEDGLLGDDDSFIDRGMIDSTGVLELVQFLEETFRVEVTDEEMVPENLDSIFNLTRFVCGKPTEPGMSQ
ncbi:MAG TPA: acyl carrier protein [Bryobacteraceae bacterium]|nr:acyl carrier protein [Bryobacteraceae bacterium]